MEEDHSLMKGLKDMEEDRSLLKDNKHMQEDLEWAVLRVFVVLQ
jgi:hypothetical protein